MIGKKVLVIGLGQIGYSNAEYMTMKGLEVDGFDTNSKTIRRAIDDQVICNKASSFADYDYYIICISIHKHDDISAAHLDSLYDIAKRISDEGKTGALVGIESTVTYGISENIMKILGHRMHVVHVPHRFYNEDKYDHGIQQIRVLGGCDDCCIEKARHFYGEILDIPLHIVESIEVAELCKIVENSYRFMEVAFAEELKMFCDRIEVSFNDLRGAINTKWNVKVLEARDGIAGPGLPKDTQMFLDLSRDILGPSILDAAKNVDSKYKSHKSVIIPPTIGGYSRSHMSTQGQ